MNEEAKRLAKLHNEAVYALVDAVRENWDRCPQAVRKAYIETESLARQVVQELNKEAPE